MHLKLLCFFLLSAALVYQATCKSSSRGGFFSSKNKPKNPSSSSSSFSSFFKPKSPASKPSAPKYPVQSYPIISQPAALKYPSSAPKYPVQPSALKYPVQPSAPKYPVQPSAPLYPVQNSPIGTNFQPSAPKYPVQNGSPIGTSPHIGFVNPSGSYSGPGNGYAAPMGQHNGYPMSPIYKPNNGYGVPLSNGYGNPIQNGYGNLMQNGYGNPMQNGYGNLMHNGYGSSIGNGYRNPIGHMNNRSPINIFKSDKPKNHGVGSFVAGAVGGAVGGAMVSGALRRRPGSRFESKRSQIFFLCKGYDFKEESRCCRTLPSYLFFEVEMLTCNKNQSDEHLFSITKDYIFNKNQNSKTSLMNKNSTVSCFTTCLFKNKQLLGDDNAINYEATSEYFTSKVEVSWQSVMTSAVQQCNNAVPVLFSKDTQKVGIPCDNAPGFLIQCIRRKLMRFCPTEKLDNSYKCVHNMYVLSKCNNFVNKNNETMKTLNSTIDLTNATIGNNTTTIGNNNATTTKPGEEMEENLGPIVIGLNNNTTKDSEKPPETIVITLTPEVVKNANITMEEMLADLKSNVD